MSDYRYDIERLKALISYEIIDTEPEDIFDNLAKLTSIICDTPAAIISFIDGERQWYKAKVGTTENEVPYEETICQYTILQDEVLEISNALDDIRLVNNPHVQSENGVRFYIGIPLLSDNGHAIGSVCAFDIVPKHLPENQIEALRLIAKQTMHLLNISKQNKKLTNEVKSILEDKIKEAKQKIEVTEKAYNNLFNAIEKSNALIEFSPNGIIQYVNDSFLSIVGYKESELIGQKYDILLDEDDKEKSLEFWESLKEGRIKSGRFKRIHKDGSMVWIQASYNPVLNEKKEITKVTKIAQNITIEINAQNALEKAKLLADELNIQKDHFIANVSHEIRTPINAVLGFTDLLLVEETNSRKINYLKSVKTAGDSLLHLINDILDLSKIETGIFQIDHSSFNLFEIIENVFSILSLKAEQKGLIFKKIIDQHVPKHILGDKNRLTQILINLLGNAIKFTSEGSVSLIVSLENDLTLKFEVIDTGIGIPNDKLKIIFGRFSQAQENTSRQFGGTGLGLNISKLLVEKLGGQINVESSLNSGSTFYFSMPFTLSSEIDKKENTDKVTPTKTNNSVHVLMCEDNEMNQKLMTEIFLGTKHKLTIANDGNEGLEMLSKNNFDLILMDIQMPNLDGYQTTTIIRQELKLDIPIIAITAHSTIKEREKCLSIGMNDYISKPFKKEELFHKIENLAFLNTNTNFIEKNFTIKKIESVNSLEYLKEMSANDDDFLQEMLSTFVNLSAENKNLLKESLNQKNFISVKKIAHKLKSSFSVIGADISILDFFENLSSENEKLIETYLTRLEKQLNSIYIEIDKILKKS